MKQSKYLFGHKELEYFGHRISGQGVAVDPAKISSMVNWPKPTFIKALRGFLSLTGNYHRFVCDYGKISQPLMIMLKMNNFH